MCCFRDRVMENWFILVPHYTWLRHTRTRGGVNAFSSWRVSVSVLLSLSHLMNRYLLFSTANAGTLQGLVHPQREAMASKWKSTWPEKSSSRDAELLTAVDRNPVPWVTSWFEHGRTSGWVVFQYIWTWLLVTVGSRHTKSRPADRFLCEWPLVIPDLIHGVSIALLRYFHYVALSLGCFFRDRHNYHIRHA